MEPRLGYILQLVHERDWSGSELARQMGISRAEANRFLNGERKGGNKLISGLLRAFPGESLDTLFILPIVTPIGCTSEDNAPYEVNPIRPARNLQTEPGTAKRKMKPVKHPSAHQIACSIDEGTGTVEIVDGKNVTTLLVPAGPIEVRHTTKQADDTS